MRTYKLKCGCVIENSDRERYVELCPPHKAEVAERHQAHAQEREAARLKLNQEGT